MFREGTVRGRRYGRTVRGEAALKEKDLADHLLNSPSQGILAVKAAPHRPVYRMHRYYARRPGNVFSMLITQVTKPDSLILDPFAGGGVTLVEGLEAGRRVVAADLNPLAAFIMRAEAGPAPLDALELALERAAVELPALLDDTYATTCPECATSFSADWIEWSHQASCECGHLFALAKAEKLGAGTWSCPSCQSRVRPLLALSNTRTMTCVAGECPACGWDIRKPARSDIELASKLEDVARSGPIASRLPDAKIPDCNMQRESALFKKGYHHFSDLFSPRQKVALIRLEDWILEQPREIQWWLWLAFSATLRSANMMVTRNAAWRGRRPLEWVGTGYWLPAVYLDAHIGLEFQRRLRAIVKGKQDFPASGAPESNPLDVARGDGRWSVICGSSTKLPLPDDSIDAVITDPPYGAYVHYADLSNFWSVWLSQVDGLGNIIDDQDEAVIARKQFPGAKSSGDYHRLLSDVFKECYRVLKPGSLLVFTFHNREPRAWAAMALAVSDAGFQLASGGIAFQEGIAAYRHTARTRRTGSVQGDFLLTFVKLDKESKELDAPIESPLSDAAIIERVRRLLEGAPMTPETLFKEFYLDLLPDLFRLARSLRGSTTQRLGILAESSEVSLFDSHRRNLLERHFTYLDGRWHANATQEAKQ